MIPSAFDYVAPRTLEEALKAIAVGGAEVKALSGGQSLIPLLKLRLAAPALVVDLGKVGILRRIEAGGDPIVLGALATHAMIEDSPDLAAACPLLCEVAASIGDRQVRNRGTIGGSLAHADPAADWPAAALALDAEIAVVSAIGAPGSARRPAGGIGGGSEAEAPPEDRPTAKPRTIAARDFFRGMLSTALADGEILVEVRLRRPGPGGAAYQKVKQSASGFAVCGVAAQLEYGPDRVCKRAAVAVTGVADRAYRATAVEKALASRRLDEAAIAAAAALAADGVADPLADIHASGDYRLHLARVHCARALRRAARLGAAP